VTHRSTELPLVSIVTPSLNHGRFIQENIESVRAQDYPRIEHLVLDGGSTDQTLEILARHGKRIRWVSEPDRGQTAALNRGFRMASGEIVSWLNTDDILLPGAVSAVVETFRANPHVGMVYGDGELMDAAGRRLLPFRFTEPFNLPRLVEVSAFILQPAAFVRLEVLRSVDYLDERLSWCMDWDLWIRIGQRHAVGFLPRPLARVRIHPDSKTSRGGLPKIREMHGVVRRHSRRWIPPILVIHAGGMLYRAICRRFGLAPDSGNRRPLSQIGWISRRLDRVLDRGQLPWEWASRSYLRRRTPPLLPAPHERTVHSTLESALPGS
jgi:glycosyltransferase involved in cell wall biosynthesis